ncbi:MAG: polyhydroxyalkanoic acid system family protein [Sphingomicrobium sp.]
MSQPIDVDLPHKLGKEEAKRRIGGNIHQLQEHIPGGADVTSRWEGDTMKLSVAAMGQAVDADITVHESKVHCHVVLPGFLALFARPIEAMLNSKGGDLLLEDKSD